MTRSRGKRTVPRILSFEKIVVRHDDHGRWSYKLAGALDKLMGEKFFAVTDEPFAAWIDEPDDVVEPADQQAQGSCPRGDSNTRHAV
jgi:type IV pilus biogenesis protein CpaD/CtpE